MKTRKLVFLDDDPDRAGFSVGPAEDGVLYIALKPEVYSALRRKGLEVYDTTAYFTNDSHGRILDRSKELSDWLRRNAPFRGIGYGVRAAYKDLFVFWARLAYTNFMWIAEIVCNAVDALGPETVAAPVSGSVYVDSLSPEPEERFLGHIVREVARRRGIRFEDIQSERNTGSSHSLFGGRMAANVRYLVKMAGFQLWLYWVMCRSKVTKKKQVIFTSRKYQMDKLAEDVSAEADSSYAACFLKGPIMLNGGMGRMASSLLMCSRLVRRFDGMCEHLIEKMHREEKLFTYRDTPLSGILAKKIMNNICPNIESLYVWTAMANESLDLLKPLAVLSNGSRSDDVAIAELCRMKGIVSILVSHGSHVCPKNDYEAIEWGEHGRALLRGPFDTLAMQSPLAEAYLGAFPTRSRTLVTGPVLWGRAVDKGKREEFFKKIIGTKFDALNTRVIVHAGTPKSSRRFRLWVYETPDEYLSALSDLARAVDVIPDAVLVVRFRPSDEISINEIRARIKFSDKIILSTEGPIDEVLAVADLLVSFSSTAIEEALQNRIPALLYGGNGRYQHVAADEISAGERVTPNAVYHVRKASDLSYALGGILGLGIGKLQHGKLFDPYVYPENSRTAIGDFLDIVSTQKNEGSCR